MSASDREPLVQLRGLERVFPQGPQSLWALRRIDLDIADNEFVSIMGPSGAGKTTLLAILGLQDDGWTGSFRFAGHDVAALPTQARARLRAEQVGFVFQNYRLLDDLTVAENLDVPLAYRDLPRAERTARVAETLDRFGLAARRDLRPPQLSGGQQQMVAIARALVGSPRLLLADEPTGNLHSEQAREVMQTFRTLHQRGLTIVQVTHAEENAAWGDRIVRLRDGWIDAETAAAQRIATFQTP